MTMGLELGGWPLLVATWPYHWTFRCYTLDPIRNIAACGSEYSKGVEAFEAFKQGKLHELHFVKVASTLSAAAVVGALAWPALSKQIWLSYATWYCSLLISMFAIIQATQQTAVLKSLPSAHGEKTKGKSGFPETLKLVVCVHGSCVNDNTSCDPEAGEKKSQIPISYRKSVRMIYIWQSPIMLMTWAWMFFGLALSVYVCAPLSSSKVVNNEEKAAIFYLCVGSMVAFNFICCSFWLYRIATPLILQHHKR